MYKTIINPMGFYWIDILEKVSSLPALIFLGGILGFLFLGMMGILMDCTDKQLTKYVRNWAALIIVLVIITGLASIFIPSKDTMYKMLIAKQVTPHNL